MKLKYSLHGRIFGKLESMKKGQSRKRQHRSQFADKVDWFWKQIEKNPITGCREWKMSVDTRGYGQLWWVHGKLSRAHRIAYELSFGPIPKGLCVLHKCDNPPCCNPSHLFLGTQKDNMDDLDRKGRRPKGESSKLSKLKDYQVRQMRTAYRNGERQGAIAARYGVNQATVSYAVSGKTWKHI